MSISEEDIKKDFQRFIYHEAMRANTNQDKILEIIYGKTNNS